MTALNVVVQSSAVYLLTDCAGYDTAGAVSEIRSKVTVAPEWRAAFACSGRVDSVRLSTALARRKVRCQQDALLALPSVVRALRDENRRVHLADDGEWNDLQVVCAIFSDVSNRPEAWIISSNAAYLGEDYVPYRLVQIRQLFSPDLDLDAVLGCSAATELTSFDPRRNGLAVLEAQRGAPWHDGLFYVGGAGQLTTVDESGVAVDILVHWPDAVGQRISPGNCSSVRVRT